MRIERVLCVSLLLGCSRRTESKTTQSESEPTALSPVTSDAGAPIVVRIHRYGGGPSGLNYTLEVTPDGSAHLTGNDTLWCHDSKPVDTRVRLDPAVFAEVRELSHHPEVTRFLGAPAPARAPEADGVAAEVALPAQPPILVDGVREVTGKMGRLLELDRELGARYGAAAAGCK